MVQRPLGGAEIADRLISRVSCEKVSVLGGLLLSAQTQEFIPQLGLGRGHHPLTRRSERLAEEAAGEELSVDSS